MNLPVALRLGRISNLPSVWTNVFVGVALSGHAASWDRVAILVLALSLFYVGGMFLNDAFDREFDARHRRDRPIPAGQVSASAVFAWGFTMLGFGVAGVMAAGWISARENGAWSAAVTGAALAGMIVLYDAHHKNNPLSPLVMGACRILVYASACSAIAASVSASVWIAAGGLLCHLIGLTYLAKQEHLRRMGHLWPIGFLGVPLAYGAMLALDYPVVLPLLALLAALVGFALMRFRRRGPGDVPRAVITLLAGICIYDAMVLVGHGNLWLAGLSLAAFGLMLGLQRWVSGT